jgi:iron complex outermembrane receptor protein
MKPKRPRCSRILLHFCVVVLISLSGMARAQTDALSRSVTINVPAEDLASALIDFSKQTGIQVITAGSRVDNLKSRGVSGEMSAGEALRRLLDGTPLGFHSLGRDTIGIDSHSASSSPTASASAPSTSHSGPDAVVPADDSASTSAAGVGEIIVTARKQKESLIDVPESISVLSSSTIDRLGIQDFADYATKIPDLSFSYGSGGLGFADSRTVAIRGISGVGTTAIYIDDTPVDEAMDPRILDVERIEVLKGPQGTLFGQGSLGGAIRLVSQKPSLTEDTFKYAGSLGGTSYGGSPDYGFNFVAGMPVNDFLALRVLGFVSHDAGFVTRTFPLAGGETASLDNQGAQLSYGGSISALLHFNDQWEVLVRLLAQQQDNHGLPVTYAPLPEFEPTSLTMDRSVNIQEYANEHWLMPTVQVTYQGNGWNIVSATSYLDRWVTETEDATEGTITASEAFFGYTPQSVVEPWYQAFHTKHLTEELRTTIAPGARISGTVGAYVSDSATANVIGPYQMPGLESSGLFPTDLGWFDDVNNVAKENAIFGEAYLTPLDDTTITVGLRKYWLRQRFEYLANGLFNGGSSAADTPNSQNGVSPKFAAEYKFDHDTSVYASAAKGFRQGGGTTPLPAFCASDLAAIGLTPASAARYTSDTVWSYEVGSKAQVLDRRLLITGALYMIDWQDIQQPVFLPTCGFTFTTNAGAARSRGAEVELAGQIFPGLDVRAGVGYDNARITEQGRSSALPGSFVHEVPELTATAAATYTQPLTAAIDGFVSTDFSHVGSSTSAISSFSSPLVRPAYNILNLRIGARRNHDELSLYATNVTDTRANLGDINPIGYVRYQNDGAILPRVAVQRPFSMGLRFEHGFQ